ncbi:putative F-box/kelch-repeat protein At1g12870 [Amaranthus tricolor]|uniref:putative F-box/kelch-repeat protein At1g12870 n=1 Tax=Amaranthus tricolor TaxID=29722 RepID=UPI00258D5675|nr:putative F-box/kelch-repeat protein At1g12870 [Amaranthus tricolor]XP_057543482.1 putative F-box/kelch-repeat protein At1g12870 [Amaranthus tricolor]XP_057543489.1 putative F-box/kelch-repeat protein At1g12870 [Amaranthus tricolor]
MKTSTSFDLPFDIITHILAMFPVKTLVKFRAVCTSWRTYIESPYFISKHRDLYNKHHSKNSHLLITSIRSGRFYLRRVTNDQNSITVTLLAPFSADFTIPWTYSVCNGLFLLSLYGDRQKGFSTSCDDYKVLAYQLRTIINGNEYEAAMAYIGLLKVIQELSTLLGDPRIIHSFDFNTEEFNNVALPEPLKECASLILFTIGELLAVISSFCI